jgi:hypothetical protein
MGEENQGKNYWNINFSYESHKNVKDLRTMMRTLIECVKDNTNEARLSHTENINPKMIAKIG